MDDDFDPALAEYSSEEEKRKAREKAPRSLQIEEPQARKVQKLPSAKELLQNSAPAFLAGVQLTKPQKRQQQKKPTSTAVIEKPAILNPAKIDPLEQYDYFARDPDANLSLWQSPQDIPDPERPWDRNKLIKKIDTRRVAVLGLEGRGKYVKQAVKRWEVPEKKDS